MDTMLSLKEKLNFDKVDLTAPDMVLEEVGEQLKEITKGMVECVIKPYDGPIRSFTQKKRSWNWCGFPNISNKND